MQKAEIGNRAMSDLRVDMEKRYGDRRIEFRYNIRRNSVRIVVGGATVATASVERGKLGIATWKNTEFHDYAKDLLGESLNNMGVEYSKTERGCGETLHTYYEVNGNGTERERLTKGTSASGKALD